MTRGLFLAVVAICAGCGSGGGDGLAREAVSGTVLRKGHPLGNGQITYVHSAGGPTASTVIRDGQYGFTRENGPIAGPHNVRIMQIPERQAVSEGQPRKDVARVAGENSLPPEGVGFEANVEVGQAEKLDFEIE